MPRAKVNQLAPKTSSLWQEDWEQLGHDVRLDGVYFSRTYGHPPFRKRLDPGAFVYFVAVIRGELILHVHFPEDETIRLNPGDAVSISGMTQHVIEAGRPGPQHSIGRFALASLSPDPTADADVELIVGCAPHEAMSLANMVNGPLPILKQRDHEYARHIWKALEFLDDEFSQDEMHFDRDQVVRRIAEIISININRAISHRGRHQMRAFTARRSEAYNHHMRGVWRSLAQFLDSPFEKWDIARLAQSAGMSRTAYCESFRHATGMSPKKSINRIQLALVARKLVTENLSLETAAELTGYNSAAAFIRSFQREFRETPAKWRAAQKK